MGTFTVSGTFSTADAALAAGERLRELADQHATIRLLLPGKDDLTVEASIEPRSDWRKIAVFGFGLGLVGAYVFDTLLQATWTVGFLGLATGAVTGVMLGLWLSGEHLFARSAERAHAGPVALALRQGHSVVSAVVPSHRVAEQVRELLENAEGYLETAERPARAAIEELPT